MEKQFFTDCRLTLKSKPVFLEYSFCGMGFHQRVFFGFYKKAIYDYYSGSMYFVPFFLSDYIQPAFRKGKSSMFGVAMVGALIIYNWQGRPFVYAPNNQLGQVELIAREIVAKTDGKPFNFALITGGNSDHAYRYFSNSGEDHPLP